MSFLTNQRLREIGFKYFGKDVKVSDKAVFYNPNKITIGNRSRIDDFCILSAGHGGIVIGNNVHISAYALILGKGKVSIGDFSALSVRTSVFSSNDDYSGNFMVNPTVDIHYTNVKYGDVNIGKHVIIGSGSIILPQVNIEEGVAVGALTLVKEDCKRFRLYAGIPAKLVKKRSDKLLKLGKLYLKHLNLIDQQK